MKKLILGLLTVTAIIFASCSKDGAQGEQGIQGEQGEQGIQGIPGKDGNVIISGTVAPTSSIGNNGDMYLDITTSNLYGPKSDGDWGIPLNLKGATGAAGEAGDDGQDGADGSKILRGNGTPSSSIGATGDYYINQSTADLYGPKQGSSWGNPINLKGTANVVTTTWIDYNWNGVDTPTRKTMTYTIPNPVIAATGASSLNNLLFGNGGVILVYGKNFGSNGYRLFDYGFRNGAYSATPNTNGNQIILELKSINGADLRDLEYDSARGNQFRYVLIPSGTMVSGKRVNQIDYSKLSWEEVKNMYNLED